LIVPFNVDFKTDVGSIPKSLTSCSLDSKNRSRSLDPCWTDPESTINSIFRSVCSHEGFVTRESSYCELLLELASVLDLVSAFCLGTPPLKHASVVCPTMPHAHTVFLCGQSSL
jgi:hypothetical protein